MSTRYSGNSEAYSVLEKEYVEGYAVETLLRRAIPDERDGMKRVQRRTLYKAVTEKIKRNDKSQKMLGLVSTIHPHGDQAIYDTMVRMCDKRGQQNIPLLEGQGSLGIVYSSDKQAAARYTEMWVHENANDFFTCQKGVDWVPAEVVSEGMEPGALNVSYPALLTMVSSGIAVSTSSEIPSFNFWDVLDITEKYMRKGVLEAGDEIVPDFPTGANIIFNQKELYKIMKSGVGRFKLRAEISVVGKEIHVEEVPYGTTIEQMRRRIKALEDIPEIQECEISTGATSSSKLTITCSNAKVVDSVVAKLMSKGILQRTVNSRMVTVFDKQIHVSGGIEGVLRRWVPWRKGVIQKHYTVHKADLEKKIEELRFFIMLINNPEWRDEYVERVTKVGRHDGAEFLRSVLEGVTDTAISWISERPISAFNNGGKYVNQYESILKEIEEAEGYIYDPKKRILEDFEDLRSRNRGKFERKTRVSKVDFAFKKSDEAEEEIDESFALFHVYRDGFIFKTRGEAPAHTGSPLLAVITAKANSVIMVLNTAGNIIRVYGEDVPFSGARGGGIHVQGYSGADDGSVVSAFELTGDKKMIYYSDGWVGFLDTSEFVGQKRKTRLVRNGVSREIGNTNVLVMDMPETERYAIVGAAEDTNLYIGVKYSENIVEKSRTSRTRLFTTPNDLKATEVLVLDEGVRDDFWHCEEGVIPVNKAMFEESMKKIPFFWEGLEEYADAFQTVE